MADLSASSNDQLQAETCECVLEIERRLDLIGDQATLNLVKRAHALLERAEKRLHAKGQITARSGGIDK